MKRKVTVLMSVFNEMKHLKSAISSILDQTFQDFEFLIIDDGSDDNSAEIIRNFKDQRITFIQNKKNIGLTKSLNIGIRRAGGEYIARIDADDIASPDRLDVQFRFMEKHPEYGLMSSCISSIGASGDVKQSLCSYLNPEDVFYLLHFRNCITHSSVMMRTSLVREAGGYDESFNVAQDYDLWLRLSKLTRCFEEWRVLSFWRDSDDNISSQNPAGQKEAVKRVFSREIKKLTGESLNDDDIDLIQRSEFTRIGSVQDLNKVLDILAKINDSILSAESEIINKLNFNRKKLNRSMKRKSGSLVYDFFRTAAFPQNLKIFMSIGFYYRLGLITEILGRVLKKTGLCCRNKLS